MNRSIARRLAFMFAAVALFVFTLVGSGFSSCCVRNSNSICASRLMTARRSRRIIVYHAGTPEKWKMAREKLTDMTPHDGATLYSVWSADPSYHSAVRSRDK